MDIISHAGWGYAALRWRGKKAAWAGALAGAAPDLLFFFPMMAERVAEKGWGAFSRYPARNPEIWRAGGPPMPPEMVHAYEHHYVYTHSYIILFLVVGLLYLIGKRHGCWFAIPYALHITMDIPTHERWQTPFLFPISRWTLEGWSWGLPWIFWPNWIALLSTLAWLYVRYRKLEDSDEREHA